MPSANTKAKQNGHLSRSGLKNRGWTDKLIDEFLGEPDQKKANPYYRSGPRVQLFKEDRIKKAEESLSFQLARELAQERQRASQKGNQTKRQRLIERIDRAEIKIHNNNLTEAIQEAIIAYNGREQRWDTEDTWKPAEKTSNPEFLHRITVNYLRHRASNYESELREIFGRVGTQHAYGRLKKRILEAIAEKFPTLETECTRQIQQLIQHQKQILGDDYSV